MQSRAQPVIQQDSTDSLLDVPMLEALQRRHSDVKINPASAGMRQLSVQLVNIFNIRPHVPSSLSGIRL
jgi:hypothetical protein